MELKTSSFQPGGMIPEKYTCDGQDVSPALTWSGAPEETKSFALICDDPDAPSGVFTHWLLYGLAPDLTSLAQGQSQGKAGMNDFRRSGYGGPCPPRGTRHRYFFKVFALDKEIDLPPKFTKQDLLNAMSGHILAEAELMGTYQRK